MTAAAQQQTVQSQTDEIAALYHDLRTACERVFWEHGIVAEHINFFKLISHNETIRAMIRQEYHDRAMPGQKDSIRNEIAAEYGMDERSLCKILYSK